MNYEKSYFVTSLLRLWFQKFEFRANPSRTRWLAEFLIRLKIRLKSRCDREFPWKSSGNSFDRKFSVKKHIINRKSARWWIFEILRPKNRKIGPIIFEKVLSNINWKNDDFKSDPIQRNFSIEDFNRLEQRLQPEKTGLFEVYQTPG